MFQLKSRFGSEKAINFRFWTLKLDLKLNKSIFVIVFFLHKMS